MLIKEIFHSIQGEGPNAGRPAFFVRFAGCNLACDFCDTDHAGGVLQEMTTNEVLLEIARQQKVLQVPTRLIVITGGEPLLQMFGFSDLVLALEFSEYYEVQVETNGTIEPPDFGSGAMVQWCVSPKLHAFTAEEVPLNRWFWRQRAGQPVACKLLVKDGDELPPWFLSFSGWKGLQPIDEKDAQQNLKNRAHVVKLCLQYNLNLSLQQHKILEIA